MDDDIRIESNNGVETHIFDPYNELNVLIDESEVNSILKKYGINININTAYYYYYFTIITIQLLLYYYYSIFNFELYKRAFILIHRSYILYQAPTIRKRIKQYCYCS